MRLSCGRFGFLFDQNVLEKNTVSVIRLTLAIQELRVVPGLMIRLQMPIDQLEENMPMSSPISIIAVDSNRVSYSNEYVLIILSCATT